MEISAGNVSCLPYVQEPYEQNQQRMLTPMTTFIMILYKCDTWDEVEGRPDILINYIIRVDKRTFNGKLN